MALAEQLADLVAGVDAHWTDAGRTRSAFTKIAARSLASSLSTRPIDFDELLEHLTSSAALPRQVDPANSFGDPPITLHFGDDFALDVYFWHQPVVAIHNHSFDGAFGVIEGASLHTHFAFTEEASHAGDVLVGRLDATQVELLKVGDVRPIVADVSHIHQVAHLAHPSVSLVLRTHPRGDDPPIFDFLKPGVPLRQTRYLTVAEHKQLAVIDLLYRVHADPDVLSSRLLARTRELVQAWALRRVAERTGGLEAARRLAERLADQAWIGPTLGAIALTDQADVGFDRVTEPLHRLAVLLAKDVPDPAERDRLVAELRPGTTFLDAIVDFTRSLSNAGAFGVPLPELAIIVLRAQLEGKDDEAVCEVVRDQFGGAPDELLENVRMSRAFFGQRALFRRLLADVGGSAESG